MEKINNAKSEKSNQRKNREAEIIKEGTIGNNIRWKINEKKELYIAGSGELNVSTTYIEFFDEEIVDRGNIFSELEGIVKDTAEALFIGEGFAAIGAFAFANFKRLKKVRIPYGVTKIDKYAFNSCDSLKDINLPDSITEIGTLAFGRCTALEEIILPREIKVGIGAFMECSNLQKVRSSGMTKHTYIDGRAFENCSKLKTVILTHVDYLSNDVFGGSPVECFRLYMNKKSDIRMNAFYQADIEEIHLTAESNFVSVEFQNEISCPNIKRIYLYNRIPLLFGLSRSNTSGEKIEVYVPDRLNLIDKLILRSIENNASNLTVIHDSKMDSYDDFTVEL